MFLTLNFTSGRPVYLQIVEQIKLAAASGALRSGDILPSIRSLAEELRVNRNTVAKAYTELENQGLIETKPGKGCVIIAEDSPLKRSAREKMLIPEIDAAISQASHLQFEDDDFLQLVRERLEVFRCKREEQLESRKLV